MTIKKSIGIEDKNGDINVFIPPAPEGDDLGGISASDVAQIDSNKTNIETNASNIQTNATNITNLNNALNEKVAFVDTYTQKGITFKNDLNNVEFSVAQDDCYIRFWPNNATGDSWRIYLSKTMGLIQRYTASGWVTVKQLY